MRLPDIYTKPEILDFPLRCYECPTLRAINEDYLEAQELKNIAQHIGEASLAGMPGNVRDEFKDYLAQEYSSKLSDIGETPESLIMAFEESTRVHASNMLDDADNTVNGLAELADEIMSECHGGPTLLYKSRNGIDFTVRICSSTVNCDYIDIADIVRKPKN